MRLDFKLIVGRMHMFKKRKLLGLRHIDLCRRRIGTMFWKKKVVNIEPLHFTTRQFREQGISGLLRKPLAMLTVHHEYIALELPSMCLENFYTVMNSQQGIVQTQLARRVN